MLNWARPFSIFLYLDSNNYPDRYGRYECLLAIGDVQDPTMVTATSMEELQQVYHRDKDWLFGHICYDYKNELEPILTSARPQKFTFPLLSFFQPSVVCYIERGKDELVIASSGPHPANVMMHIERTAPGTDSLPRVHFKSDMGRSEYLSKVNALREHIRNGDCYEINFCREAFAEDIMLDPVHVFSRLTDLSPAPFAACYRHDKSYMMCSSPERYLLKDKELVLSQPIKGTARRGGDAIEDEAIKNALRSSIKETAENVMITDLVRNDLARSCRVGSVQAEELFGIYTFPQVHQMISTISGHLQTGVFTDAIRYSFPMGSMTGAPKIKVMQLVEQYELARRELFSGAVGYISPGGDFDLNVIIRSLFYNSATRYLSYQTGGAITFDSDPAMEWEEMRLKAGALERVFDSA